MKVDDKLAAIAIAKRLDKIAVPLIAKLGVGAAAYRKALADCDAQDRQRFPVTNRGAYRSGDRMLASWEGAPSSATARKPSPIEGAPSGIASLK